VFIIFSFVSSVYDCRHKLAANISSSKNPPSELILINYEVNILVLRDNKNLFITFFRNNYYFETLEMPSTKKEFNLNFPGIYFSISFITSFHKVFSNFSRKTPKCPIVCVLYSVGLKCSFLISAFSYFSVKKSTASFGA